MSTVNFQCMGTASLSRDGLAVRLHSNKTMALLAYLVCEVDRAHSREALSALFWADSPRTRARQNLRQTLYSLRRALGDLADECLQIEQRTIQFRPNRQFSSDLLTLARFASAPSTPLTVEELSSVASLYQGPLLQGLEFTDAPELNDWLFLMREHYGQVAIRLLQKTVDELLSTGELDEAMRYGRRLLALDGLNEGAHRRLMRLYAALGDLDATTRQYRQCVELLDMELGVEPTEETTVLYEQLLAGTETIPSVDKQKSTIASTILPFVGCAEELAHLSDGLNRAIAGETSLLLVRAEVGMGKSSLVETFLQRTASEKPLRWLHGRCYEAEIGAPYTVWSDALAQLDEPVWSEALNDVPSVWKQELARLAPKLAPVPVEQIDLSIAEHQLRLLQGVIQGLSVLAESTPLVIFFDDLHWADHSSLALMHYAARHLVHSPVLFIGAYRADLSADNEFLRPLLVDDEISIIEVSPIAKADIARLLAGMNMQAPQALIQRLHQHCGGNRFILVETLRMLADSGSLDAYIDDVLPAPPRVKMLIQTRLDTLEDPDRRLLAAATIIGRPADPLLLRLVSGQPETQVLDALDHLTRRSLMTESNDGTSVAIFHDLVRQVIYEGLGSSRRRALHKRFADALTQFHQRHRTPMVVEEIAYHYEQASDDRAFEFLQQAAEAAADLFDIAHATELYTRALTFADNHPSTLLEADERFQILLSRESLLDQQARRAEQEETISTLLSLSEQLTDPRMQAIAYVRQASYLSLTGMPDRSYTVAQQALDVYKRLGDGQGEAIALRELGFLYWVASDFGQALHYGRLALDAHRKLGDILGEATALHNLGEIHRGLQSPSQALTFYGQALELQWATQDHRRQCLTLYGMAHAQRQLGVPEAALNRYQQALVQAERANDRILTSRVYHELGSLALEDNDMATAMTQLQQAVEISEAIGYAPGISHGYASLSHLHGKTGNNEEAQICAEQAVYWFKLMEDQAGVAAATRRLHQLRAGNFADVQPPSHPSWIKTHITLSEGKVYCEFESPFARSSSD